MPAFWFEGAAGRVGRAEPAERAERAERVGRAVPAERAPVTAPRAATAATAPPARAAAGPPPPGPPALAAATAPPPPQAAPAIVAAPDPEPSPAVRALETAETVLVESGPVSRREQERDGWGWTEPWSFEVPAPTAGELRAARQAREAARRPHRRNAWRHAVIVFGLLAVAVSVWIAVPRSSPASARPAGVMGGSFAPHPSAFALHTIPIAYLHDYWRVAEEYGLDWTKLAAVGQLESDQGRSQAPGVSQGTNIAGAAGPAQFLGSTWARYGVDADGHGTINPYDPVDAITAMAAYLKASGAPQHWRVALYAYNHSTAYVRAVMSLHRLYLRRH